MGTRALRASNKPAKIPQKGPTFLKVLAAPGFLLPRLRISVPATNFVIMYANIIEPDRYPITNKTKYVIVVLIIKLFITNCKTV